MNIKPEKERAFVKDVFKLMSGMAAAQLLLVLASPALTRLFSPDAFGTFSTFFAIVTILAGILCLKYEDAIMLPKEDSAAANLFVGSIAASMIMSALVVLAVWLFGDKISTLLHAPDLNLLMWLIPVVLLFGGLSIGHPALNGWATRTKRYKELSVVRIAGAFTTIAVQLGAGILGYSSSFGLAAGAMAGSVISPLILGQRIWREDKRIFLSSVNIKSISEVLFRYRKFPLYNIWSVLLNNISWQIPIFLLSFFFSPEVSGFYALGFRVFQIPMSLIGSSYAQVFYKQASDANRMGELAPVVRRAYWNLVRLGLFPFLVLTIIGREIFILIFGIQWAEAGIYAQILGVWAFVWFVSSSISNLYNLLEKQELILRVNVMLLCSRFAALALGGWVGSPRLAIWLFSFTGILIYGYQIIILTKLSGVEAGYVYKTLAGLLIKFSPGGVVLTSLLFIHLPSWIYVCLGVFWVVFYYIGLIRHDEDFRLLLAKLFTTKAASS